MTVSPKVLVAAKIAEATQTTQYTAGAGVTTIIDKFVAANYAGTAQTLSVNLVSSGGTAGNENLVVKAKSLQASETYTFPEVVGNVLAAGGFISTIAGGTASINLRVSGREVT